MTTPEDNKTTLEAKTCHKCGSTIMKEAPQGLCPKCVLGGAASSSTLSTRSGKQSPPPALDDVANAFPDLEILELIGVGGMGAVYRARQKSLDREVALKILSSDLSDDPAFAERFNREGRVLARLSHPNIVGIFDFGNKGPFSFLLMEYVDGVNLRQAMRAGDFTPAESLALVQDICSALIFAHEKGILHRDIKPENILIDKEGKVKIADFGIAKLVGENEQDDFTLTLQGSVMGSPQYMAPEQIETPDDVDQRADIYSLGVVLYELLTGELPLGRFAEPSKKATLDQRIDELVMRSLEKEREARFQSATELKTQVEIINQSPESARHYSSGDAVGNNSQYTSTETNSSNKFATLSAILTGSSIAFAFAGMLITNSMGRTTDTITLIFWLAMALLVGVPAICGLVFGMKALGNIHHSTSSKTGLGMALFGTWAWAQLILITLALSMMMVPYIGTEQEIATKMMRLSILCIVTLAIGIPCAISIYKWAKNGPNVKPSIKIWMTTSLSLAIICMIACIMAYLTYPYKAPSLYSGMREDIQSEISLPAKERIILESSSMETDGNIAPVQPNKGNNGE